MQGYSKINPVEADLLVQSLRPLNIDKFGSSTWKEQRESLETLNFCSHTNASLKKDDFVLSSLVKHEKLPIILHELLVMDVWRRKIFPTIKEQIFENPSANYMYCNYELILLNFLECLMFFEEAVVGFDDSILELIDYCWRQVNLFLGAGTDKISTIRSKLEPNNGSQMQIETIDDQEWRMQSTRAMTCISILWFIVDRLGSLSMAVVNSVLLKNDLLVGFSDVLMCQPWMRKGKGLVQKYINGRFDETDDQMRVCVPEAHSWFVIHKLLCDKECRKKYPYTTYKKEAILRIKRFLNETLIDQIPALVDVQRALEELSFLEPPSGTEEKFKSSLIIEPVAQIIGSLENRSDWKQLGESMSRMLSDPRERMEDAKRLARIFDQILGSDE